MGRTYKDMKNGKPSKKDRRKMEKLQEEGWAKQKYSRGQEPPFKSEYKKLKRIYQPVEHSDEV